MVLQTILPKVDKGTFCGDVAEWGKESQKSFFLPAVQMVIK